jgi:hypothetical protein
MVFLRPEVSHHNYMKNPINSEFGTQTKRIIFVNLFFENDFPSEKFIVLSIYIGIRSENVSFIRNTTGC